MSAKPAVTGTGLQPGAATEQAIADALLNAPIRDIHTHLFAPPFGSLLISGIDALLTYHYLVAEFMRVAPDGMTPDAFYALSEAQQANLIWEHLFVRRSPISEAARGVVTCLSKLGLDTASRDLADHRAAFDKWSIEQRVDLTLESSGVKSVVMTNDPFDEQENASWQPGFSFDSRFHTALRLDGMFDMSAKAVDRRMRRGINGDHGDLNVAAARRFVDDWCDKINPIYIAASTPPDFHYPDYSISDQAFREVLIPVARERKLPLAVMMGCRRQINPALRLAGDGVGVADLSALQDMCYENSDVKFLTTVLARENQHELAVLARKFANLHIFGCWWFVNVSSLTDEITRMRLELLGHSFTPQHSDARILEQLIYKWSDTRVMLRQVLVDKYAALQAAGWTITAEQIEREVEDLLGGCAWRYCGLS